MDDELNDLSEAEIAAMAEVLEGEDEVVTDNGDDTDLDLDDNDADATDTSINPDADGLSDKETHVDTKPTEPAAVEPVVVEDNSAELADIEAQKAQAGEDFDNGDMTSKEYRAAIAELEKREREIERASLLAEARDQAAKEAGDKEWKRVQGEFFARAENKRFSDDEILLSALNNQVIKLARGEMANASGAEILAAARSKVAKSFGMAEAVKPDSRPQRPSRPQTLPDIGGAPAAAGERPQDGKFAHLNRLTGEALENALERMSKAELDEWERS